MLSRDFIWIYKHDMPDISTRGTTGYNILDQWQPLGLIFYTQCMHGQMKQFFVLPFLHGND